MGETERSNSSSIDTSRPIDSVKSMVNKLGGVAGWRARKNAETEQKECEKIKEEIPKYKKKLKDVEIARTQAEEELENTKKLIDELQVCLEKAVKERDDEEAIEELKSVKEEIQTLQGEYNLLVADKEEVINKADEAMFRSKAICWRVE